jgi:DNA-binding CsgD family transcriptional regulator
VDGGELLERSGELECLRNHVENAAAGRGSVCVIAGPAGIGKTTLLEACCELAAEAGVRGLRAHAGRMERDLSWNLVRQLFSDVIALSERARAEVLTGAAALAAPALGLERGREGRALHGLYWLTTTLAQERPLLLAVDDAQWGDVPSLEYLAYIGSRVADLPVCIVVAVRSGEGEREPLATLAARPESEFLTPRPLSVGASAALTIAALGANAADEFCAACHTATQGNPFLLRELLDQLERDQVQPSAEGAAEIAQITPENVIRAVLLRLSQLSADARELAGAVAILGDGGRLADAADLGGLGSGRDARAADALVHAGILRAGAPLSFVHPLVREVVYGSLPMHERAHRHRQAARLLAQGGADPGRVATQLLASQPGGDPWVVESLRIAAQGAIAQGAPSPAADLLERALREPPVEHERPRLLAELGRVELAAGRGGAVEHLCQAAELSLDPHERARTLFGLGGALYVIGEPREAAEVLERGLRELALAGAEDRSLAAQLQAGWLGVARTEMPLRARAAELLHELAARPPRAESYGERALLAQVAGQLTFEGEPCERPLELARMALGEGELIRQETSDGTAWIAAMGALGWGDDFDAFDRLQELAMEDARRRGSVVGFASASYGYSFSHYYRGMLSDAIADTQFAISAEREGWRQFLPSARAQLAWALVERGELDAAAAQLELARRDTSWEGSSQQALVLEAQARVHLARSEYEQALQAALAAGEVAIAAVIPNPSIVPWRARAALAAAGLGRHEQARQLVGEGLRLARRFGAPRAIGMALTTLGIVRGADGSDALEEAVDVLASSPARLEHARALVHLGRALRRQGRLKAAAEILQAGLRASIACQALVLEQVARGELAAAGARPRRRPPSGVEALTPAELRVVELAAREMSNREIAQALFVSLRTVETHLTHAYQKLDLTSRSALPTALAHLTSGS